MGEFSVDEFLANRAWLKHNQPALVAAAYREQADLLGHDPARLFIYDPDWMLAEPVDLATVEVELEPGAGPEPAAEAEALSPWWPRDPAGAPIARYSDAISTYDKPANWFNAASYRLLDVKRRADGGFALRVATSTYWDCYDSWAALQYEAARMLRQTDGRTLTGPYRKALGSPFDLAARHCALGVSVFTLVRGQRGGGRFYLQRRSSRGVASMAGMTGLIPAGEFQPPGGSPSVADADLWRLIMREYAEELLGVAETTEPGAPPIDYAGCSPYRELQEARRAGALRLSVLDFGFDPLSWKAGIRIACVFDEDAFAAIFSGMARRGVEGTLDLPGAPTAGAGAGAGAAAAVGTGRGSESAAAQDLAARPDAVGGLAAGWPLDEPTVRRFADDPGLTEAARLCIRESWAHREKLGLAATGA